MAAGDCVVEGRALIGEDLEERDVAIVIENGRIHRSRGCFSTIDPLESARPSSTRIPTWATSVAMDTGAKGSLESLVTPPYGLKPPDTCQDPSS